MTAVLVAINSLFQILAYSFLGYFYITLLPTWLGLGSSEFRIDLWPVARTVLIFLGIHPPRRRLSHPPPRTAREGPRVV